MTRPGPALVFLVATEMEAQGLLDSFSFQRNRLPGGFTFFLAQDLGCLVSGPGAFNTAAGLGACLAQFSPKLVIDMGIAGAFPDTGLAIGDLAVADQETYAHTGDGQDGPLPFDLIEGVPDTRTGSYPLNPKAADRLRIVLDRAGLGPVPAGPFLTVSRITDTREKARGLSAEGLYLMESMEGAAAAHVCSLFQVPMAEIRTASNIAGERDKTLWDIPRALNRLTRACQTLARNLPRD